MANFNRAALKNRAKTALTDPPANVRRLVLIFCLFGIGAPLVLEVASYLLPLLAPAGIGLSALKIQNTFDTISSFLAMLPSLLLPFWNVGFVFVSIGLLHREKVEDRDLAEGFRKFLPFLRLFLLECLIFFGLAMAGVYIGSALGAAFISDDLAVLLEELSQAQNTLDIQQLLEGGTLEQLLTSMLPTLGIMLLAMLVLIVPMAYRLSLSQYVLLEATDLGALGAISLSRRFTKKHCFHLFLLDLSFLWYYLLQILVTGLGMTPLFLELFGVNTGLSPQSLAILSTVLSAAGSFLLAMKFMPYIFTTYAAAFEALRDAHLPKSIEAGQ